MAGKANSLGSGCDFFITYNRNDAEWAEWIAAELQRAGHCTRIQAWDFLPGDNFMAKMNSALEECRHVVGVLSEHYLASAFTTAEWTAAYRETILGRERGFIPVRVSRCTPPPLLGPIVYIDLVGVDEAEARSRLLDGVAPSSQRQPRLARFPGTITGSTP
jgi:hypothetical protein